MKASIITIASVLLIIIVDGNFGAIQHGSHPVEDIAGEYQALPSPSQGLQPVKPTLPNRVFNRAIRGPAPVIGTRQPPVNKSPQVVTSKSTPPPPSPTPDKNTESEQPSDNEDSEIDQESENSTVTTSSTTVEPTKRTVGGVLRPFRTNKDLLDNLKRRRQMQQQQHGLAVSTTQSTTTTTEKTLNKNSSNRKSATPGYKNGSYSDQSGVGTQKKASTSGRRFNSNKSTYSTTTTVANVEQENEQFEEETAPVTQSSRRSSYLKARRLR